MIYACVVFLARRCCACAANMQYAYETVYDIIMIHNWFTTPAAKATEYRLAVCWVTSSPDFWLPAPRFLLSFINTRTHIFIRWSVLFFPRILGATKTLWMEIEMSLIRESRSGGQVWYCTTGYFVVNFGDRSCTVTRISAFALFIAYSKFWRVEIFC